MTSPDAPDATSPRTGGAPARAWLRPGALLLGGCLAAGLLVLAEQRIVAVLLVLFGLFMAYWTSPLRTGPHTPLVPALARRGDDVVIILWAPGSTLSARLQTAIRGSRPDVVWVNVYQDSAAQRLLTEHGGSSALPLVIVGDDVKGAASVVELLEMQEAGKRRAGTRGGAER